MNSDAGRSLRISERRPSELRSAAFVVAPKWTLSAIDRIKVLGEPTHGVDRHVKFVRNG